MEAFDGEQHHPQVIERDVAEVVAAEHFPQVVDLAGLLSEELALHSVFFRDLISFDGET